MAELKPMVETGDWRRRPLLCSVAQERIELDAEQRAQSEQAEAVAPGGPAPFYPVLAREGHGSGRSGPSRHRRKRRRGRACRLVLLGPGHGLWTVVVWAGLFGVSRLARVSFAGAWRPGVADDCNAVCQALAGAIVFPLERTLEDNTSPLDL